MNYKRIIAVLFLIVGVTSFLAFKIVDDDPIISKIAAQLDAWLGSNPQEKIYLQMDKPYYATGDTIWFKAYDVIARKHQLSALSGVLNVDLIDDRDSIKQSIKLPIESGVSWGDFTLSDTIKEGNYRIRAYTNWMRNAGEDYFFDKTINVVSAINNSVYTQTKYTYSTQNNEHKVNASISFADANGKRYASKNVSYEVKIGGKTIGRGKGQTDDIGNINISFSSKQAGAVKNGKIITSLQISDKTTVEKQILLKATSGNVDVQFFPEGGNLVNGNDSKIAFKAIGADGLGTDVKGIVVDGQNKEVANFNSTHLGMGSFSFTPESGKSYKAKLTYADGSENTVDLPKAGNEGFSIAIDDTAKYALTVKILPGATAAAGTAQPGGLILIAQANGVVYYAAKSEPGTKDFTAHILKRKFPSGIVQFTLFSPAGEPLNERLVFIQNADQLKMDLTAKESYAPREKVKVMLNVADRVDKPVMGSFSVSVTNETKMPVDEASENTIISNLLLTSDIKGYIEKPNYYFADVNEKTRADLDVLMLTQGYRRFEWKQLLNNSIPAPVYQVEKSLAISGQLKSMIFNKPLAKGQVRILSNKGGFFMIDTLSDNEGNFTFNDMVFNDSTKFLIQGRSAKDRKNIKINLNTVSPQPVGFNKNAPDQKVNLGDGLSPFLQSSKDYYENLIKYGVVKRPIMLNEVVIKEKKNVVLRSENLNGPGNADAVILADKLGNCGSFLLNCLQGLIPGVTFKNGLPYNIRQNATMAIVVDGNFVDDDVFTEIDPTTVESVEAIVSLHFAAIYGSRAANGALIITTKRGRSNADLLRYAPGVVIYTPKGYYKAREFYSPQYDNPKTNTQIPDIRNTIYWKPNIITDKDGKASFEYFNADTKGTYRVVVEGIDADGNLGRQVYRYKVQ
ncbi:TonB-dependent receptor [Mucilaginibacter sp.]|uniref:TonB-dependent receptor n=1 Tax=Mucilaginibacter sp. TaxID=1882438 RepID=UPI003D0CBCAF